MTIKTNINKGTFNPQTGQGLWWSYYDRAILLSTTLIHRLFTEKLGGVKTLADTNFPAAGEMPSSQKQTIMAIEIWMYFAAAFTQALYQNFIDMCRNTTLTFTITNKSPQLQIPLTQAFGLNVPNVITGGVVGDQGTIQNTVNNVFELPIPIVLQAQTPFSVDIEHHTAPSANIDAMKIYVANVGPLETL